MRRAQSGIGLGGLLAGSVILILVVLLGLKLTPAYIEYFTAKKAIVGVGQEKQGASVIEIRKAFDLRAAIDDIRTPTANDLEITKEGNEVVIAFAYRKEVPLFGNLGVYIDFAARSKE